MDFIMGKTGTIIASPLLAFIFHVYFVVETPFCMYAFSSALGKYHIIPLGHPAWKISRVNGPASNCIVF